MIELAADFRDVLIELHDAGARFAVIGGHAVAFHGHPRATKNLDVLVRADERNAELVYRALAAFRSAALRVPSQHRRLRHLRRRAADRASATSHRHPQPRRRITFDEAVEEGASFELEGRAIPVIGRAALLKNKRASARPQDLADIAALERSEA